MIIKTRRQQKLLSQEQLAELCGLSLRTIQRVEAGHRIGYTSLKALAAQLDINVDTLEQELNNVEKSSSEFKDIQEIPKWVWGYWGFGNRWLAANRQESQKIEKFCRALSVILSVLWLVNYSGVVTLPINTNALPLGIVGSLWGAYSMSMNIRLGDKYDVWSRLETTSPNGLFGLRKKTSK
jgi:transcriptional regulator with XRE-family HTH domain